jgi:hypothetical protein
MVAGSVLPPLRETIRGSFWKRASAAMIVIGFPMANTPPFCKLSEGRFKKEERQRKRHLAKLLY